MILNTEIVQYEVKGISYEVKQRLLFVEVLAYWEGKITTNHLQSQFGISRSSSSKLVKLYHNFCPHNLEYDASKKGFCPTKLFSPRFSKGLIDEYRLQLEKGQQHETEIVGISQLEAPLRNINVELVRPILLAMRTKQRIDIGYTSLTSPEYTSRIISPHNLVFDGARWHVRAYCGKNQGYRDFLLSRFNGEYEFEGDAEFTAEHDHKWNTWLALEIIPDPRLTLEQQQVIATDYQMEESAPGQWLRVLKVRAALLMYQRQRLRLDRYEQKPEAQQIIVSPACEKAIEPYMPK